MTDADGERTRDEQRDTDRDDAAHGSRLVLTQGFSSVPISEFTVITMTLMVFVF